MKMRILLFCILGGLTLHGSGYGQTVSAGTGGDFATLTLAIESFLPGGSNEANGAPNVINCLDTSYDETFPQITVQLTINGAVGRSTLLGQENIASDGFTLDPPAGQEIQLNDLILLPSTTLTPFDDLVGIVGATGSQVTFNRCVVSSNFSGGPLSLDGFTAPTGAPTAQVFDNGIDISDAGSEATVNLNETVVTLAGGDATAPSPDNILLTGSAKNVLNINAGCVISYGQYRNILSHNVDDLFIRGTPAQPVYVLGADGVQIGSILTATGRLVIDECIIANGVATAAHADYAAGVDIQTPDRPTSITNTLIINNDGPGLLVQGNYSNNLIVKNVTISHNALGTGINDVAQVLILNLGATPNISLSDTIIAGGKTGIQMGTGSINVSYSALVTEGTDALTAAVSGTGTVNQTAVISLDPIFLEIVNLGSSDLYDVHSAAYGGQGSGGSDLAGGADYVGNMAPTRVRSWSLF